MNRLYRYTIAIVWLITATLTSMPALADTFQSHESIRLATRSFLDQRVNAASTSIRFRIDVDQLDLNIALPMCPSALEGFLPLGGRLHGRTTVGVRCPVDHGWTIYVPARVKVFRKLSVG